MVALYLERFMNYGLTADELLSGKPIIGIAQTGGDLTPCNRVHLDTVKRVREGIRDAGGVPMEFPLHPIFENCRRPTAALDRNLAYLGLVEILHGYPIDAVVLTTGCDKTTPAQIMAASTVDIPAIVLSGGPMLDGWHDGDLVGSGTVIWRSRRKLAAGQINEKQFLEAAAASAPSLGHCNTMGTASTMNAVAEVLGLSLPGCAAIPAPYRERGQISYETGRRIVEMAYEDLRPSKILTRQSFLNAIAAIAAIGGSTNAQPHLVAMARHAGIEITPDDWMKYGRDIPLLVNMQPAGKYLGERFHRAGGVPAVLSELLRVGKLDGKALTVTGRTLAENVAEYVAVAVGSRSHHDLREARAGKGRLPRPEGQPLRFRHHEDQRDLAGIPQALPRRRRQLRVQRGGVRRLDRLSRSHQRSCARHRRTHHSRHPRFRARSAGRARPKW